MATIFDTDIRIWRGDTWEEDWVLTQEDGNPFDLTGVKLFFTVKTDPTIADVSANLRLTSTPSSGITITDAANGEVSLSITQSQTAALTPQSYYYDIQVVTATPKVYTLARGRFIVEADITIGIT